MNEPGPMRQLWRRPAVRKAVIANRNTIVLGARIATGVMNWGSRCVTFVHPYPRPVWHRAI